MEVLPVLMVSRAQPALRVLLALMESLVRLVLRAKLVLRALLV